MESSEKVNVNKGSLEDKKDVPPRLVLDKKKVASFGIIAFCKTQLEGLKFLIYQRRDNYEYIDILRGNWLTEDRLKTLFDGLSAEEKQRLREYTFKELWDDLWIVHDSHIHKSGYEGARTKYEVAKVCIQKMLFNSAREGKLVNEKEPPWGFPKGKKNISETELECAIREFSEESGIPLEKMQTLTPMLSIKAKLWREPGLDDKVSNKFLWSHRENFIGKDGKMYYSIYFVIECPEEYSITYRKTPGIRKSAVSEESADAQWVTYETACLKLNAVRQGMLTKIRHRILNADLNAT